MRLLATYKRLIISRFMFKHSCQKIFKYIVKPKGIKSRYIKLKASNIGQCPEYHPGSGGKAWIFTDEIIIL